MNDVELLEHLGMDAVKWAAEFRKTATKFGYSDMDEGWLIGWFANAIMAGHDHATGFKLAVLSDGSACFAAEIME